MIYTIQFSDLKNFCFFFLLSRDIDLTKRKRKKKEEEKKMSVVVIEKKTSVVVTNDNGVRRWWYRFVYTPSLKIEFKLGSFVNKMNSSRVFFDSDTELLMSVSAHL